MTKREREQVVELLRCAADERPDGVGLNGMFDAATGLRSERSNEESSWIALLAVQRMRGIRPREVVGTIDEGYRYELLEAAARVEEGSWP